MDLVVDANILFASFIANGDTAALLFNPNLNLHAPEFMVQEFLKYNELIKEKTKRTPEELVGILHVLKTVINIY